MCTVRIRACLLHFVVWFALGFPTLSNGSDGRGLSICTQALSTLFSRQSNEEKIATLKQVERFLEKKDGHIELVAAGKEVPEYTLSALAKLRAAGGEGELVQMQYKMNDGVASDWYQPVVRVTKAPTESIYGSAFVHILREADLKGVPILLIPKSTTGVTAGKLDDGRYTDSPHAVIFADPDKVGNVVWRHEWRHVLQVLEDPSPILTRLPNLPADIAAEIERVRVILKKQGWISRGDALRLKAVQGAEMSAAEVAATWEGLRYLISPQGIKEVFVNRRAHKEIPRALQEMLWGSSNRLRLFLQSAYLDPKNPRNVLLLMKAGPAVVIYTLPAGILIAILSSLGDDDDDKDNSKKQAAETGNRSDKKEEPSEDK